MRGLLVELCRPMNVQIQVNPNRGISMIGVKSHSWVVSDNIWCKVIMSL